MLGYEVTAGNVHDSVAFDPLYDQVAARFPEIKTVVMDKAYKTPWICVCSCHQVLRYRITNREGYRGYKSDPKICADCPTLQKRTQSKNCVKVVVRHVWEGYLDRAEAFRRTPEGKASYARRKETIERVFADAKEKHGLRYTHMRGLTRVTAWVGFKFAAMNLKKLACWGWKDYVAFVFALIDALFLLLPQKARNGFN